MHSAGHLHQPSANLLIAPCRLKWINLSHVDQNFPVKTFIVDKLQIKIFIPQNVLELAAVSVNNHSEISVESGIRFILRHTNARFMNLSVTFCRKLRIYWMQLVTFKCIGLFVSTAI